MWPLCLGLYETGNKAVIFSPHGDHGAVVAGIGVVLTVQFGSGLASTLMTPSKWAWLLFGLKS
jgi:hypothetical protein